MSITDELREIAAKTECANGRCEKLYRGDLEHIADRIDAEHERQCAESWMRGHDAWAAIDRSDEMSEHGWIRLPKDADGEVIHIGDVMEWVRYEDDDKTIVRKVSAVGAGVFFAWSDEKCNYAQYNAQAYRHHHEPTVEDVLREFALAVCKDDALTIRKDVVDEYAAKLQLREDA